MRHKLRTTMGSCDERYELEGQLELDEGFFSTITPKEEKDKPLKRGRESRKKTTVLVMAESSAVEGKPSKKGKPRKVQLLMMQVIDSLRADTITPIVERSVVKMASLDTDHSTSCVKLKVVVENHHPTVQPV